MTIGENLTYALWGDREGILHVSEKKYLNQDVYGRVTNKMKEIEGG